MKTSLNSGVRRQKTKEVRVRRVRPTFYLQTTYVSKDERKKLESLAFSRKISVRHVIRTAIQEHLEKFSF